MSTSTSETRAASEQVAIQRLVEQPVVLETTDQARGPTRVSRRKPRSGMALCLSGGGFRASIFHVGALQRLNELGVLAQVDAFSCVSGGSIIGGYLAAAIQRGMKVVDGRYSGFDEAMNEFLKFVRRDIRTLPALARLKFWEPHGRAPRAIQKYYQQLVGPLKLAELPKTPRFVFCGTDLFFANSWICERTRVGDFAAGYARPSDDWTLAQAIAVSSCFPPVFDPLPAGIPPADYRGHLKFDDVDDDDENGVEITNLERLNAARRRIELTDGGVYDNLGLEPVWKTYKTILVSDGGKPMPHKWVPPGMRLMRYQEVINNQVLSLRKRWLIDTYQRSKKGTNDDVFNGTYWGISSSVSKYDKSLPPGFSKGLSATVANIRTDLNPFSPNEILVLTKHGYDLADAAARTHLAAECVPFPDAPRREWPVALQNEPRVKQALGWSASRLWSTFTAGSRSLLD